jgi:hypothetical protein
MIKSGEVMKHDSLNQLTGCVYEQLCQNDYWLAGQNIYLAHLGKFDTIINK